MRSLILSAALLLSGSMGAWAYGAGQYVYTDIRKPHGAARGDDALHADGYKCRNFDNWRIGTPSYNRCMARFGWRLTGFHPASTEDDPPASPASDPTPTPDPAPYVPVAPYYDGAGNVMGYQ